MAESHASGLLDGVELWDGHEHRGRVRIRWSDGIVEVVESGASTTGEALSVIPGLVDTHVHLDVPVADGRPADLGWGTVTGQAEQSLHVLGNALRFAQNGVTTLRDMWSHAPQFAAARALRERVLPGPRLLANGPVGMTAGHGDLFTPHGVSDRPPTADGVDECRRLVRRWARDGADGIKIYTSGGILSMGDEVGWRNHTLAETEAIIDEAHALGKRVGAHALNAEGIDIALAVGVDSIQHGTGLLPRHVDELLARALPIAPTLLVHESILRDTDPRREEARRQTAPIVAHRDENFAAAASRGVRFVLGTDANGRLVPYDGAQEELRRMRDLFGWSDERALIAGTSDAAASLGLGDVTGTVAAGYSADLLIVRGRPWEDLGALTTDRLVAVVARGRVLSGVLPG
ncbi:MAG: amidohydrolase family protein [Microbacterium sp.]|uniref:amidohydrolase family protein n=1 Tax=Microbacterium sp. TaxID=51671 RepID=UPI0039E32257